MENVGFGIMRILAKAQSPSDGGRKFADSSNGSIGTNGEVLGAPDKQTIGKISNQISMNSDLSNPALKEELWNILNKTTGEFSETFAIN